jgi:membrane-associated protease RseP (regulator of RpoE activity)
MNADDAGDDIDDRHNRDRDDRDRDDDRTSDYVRRVREAKQPRRLLLHIGLFLATFLTTTAAGAIYVHGQDRVIPIGDGLPYSVPLLLILVCHELGHYFTARAHGVDASLPYFIPLPPWLGLGTMGAVIGMREVTSDRKKLIDIGAAGPLCGIVVAIPVILYGLYLSRVGRIPTDGLQEGNSLLYAVLKRVSKGEWLPYAHRDVALHPTAWAGWAGLLVTMINLLPVGQLDGGHIATAYFGNGYQRFARWVHRGLPVMAMGVFAWVMHLVRGEAGDRWDWRLGTAIAGNAALFWLVWFALLSILGRFSGGRVDHPPVEDQPLPASRKALFWLVVVVFVTIFMPVPLRVALGSRSP